MSMTKMKNLLHVVAVLRDANPEMTVQQLEVLLRAATEEGIGVRTMVARTGQTQSSASRNLRMFCDKYTPTKDGLGFLEWRQDKTDFRAKGAYLTAKGRLFIQRITELL